MPQQHMVIPHYMGREMETESKNVEDSKTNLLQRQDSFSSRSSLQDIPLLLPQEHDSVDSPTSGCGSAKANGLSSAGRAIDQQSKTPRNQPFSFRRGKPESELSDLPMKAFVDDLDVDCTGKLSSTGETLGSEWWETQERGDQILSTDESGQVGPRTSCRCQVSYTLQFYFFYCHS